MSKIIKTLKNTGRKKVDLDISRFLGNKDQGLMIQLSQGIGGVPDTPGFIQLTQKDVYLLIIELTKWLKKTSKEKAERIQKEIDKNKILKKPYLKTSLIVKNS